MITHDQKAKLYGVPESPQDRAQRFESLSQWVDANDDKKSPHERFERSSRKKSKRDWDYGTNYAQTLELVRNGWAEGARSVLNLSGTAVTGDDVEAVALHQAPFGIFADVQAAMNGDLEPFYTVDYAPQKAPVITLLSDITCGANMSPRTFTTRGAGILTAIKLIESSGIRVELYAMVHSKDGKHSSTTAIKVKHPDQDLYLDGLAAVFAHPAPFRRLGFSDIERHVPATFSDSYGRADGAPSDAVLRHLFPEGKPVVAMSLASPRDVTSVKQVARGILQRIHDQGKATRETLDQWLEALS